METQKIWIVCGAGEGLGPATVRYLLLRKQQVVAIPYSTPPLETYFEKYREDLPGVDVRPTNVFRLAETERTVRSIIDSYGKIDNLINIGDSGLLGLQVFCEMQKAGKGHIIQFVNASSEESKSTGHGFPFSNGETSGVLLSVIEPNLFFQGSFFHPNKKEPVI